MTKTTVVQVPSETGFNVFESRDVKDIKQTTIIKIKDPTQWSDDAMSRLLNDVMGVQDETTTQS
jgi:hypothetical protein